MFITQITRSKFVSAFIIVLLCLGYGVGLANAQEKTDPKAAMEQMLARLATQREVRSTEAAEQLLRAADQIVRLAKTEGFTHALELRIAQCAVQLRAQLAADHVDHDAVSREMAGLNEVIRTYREIETPPTMHVVQATSGKFTQTTKTQAQWQGGLLVNVKAVDGKLVLADDQVVELQGQSDFIETTLLTRDLPEDDEVTMSFWLFPTDVKAEMAIIEGNIAGKYDRWQVTYLPTGQMAIRNDGPQSANTYTPVGSVPAGQWTHISMTYVRGEMLPALYVNGLLAGKQQGKRDYPLRATRDKPIRFGCEGGRHPESFFMLRDVRMWHGVRSEQQIQDGQFGRLTGQEADLIGYWPLDEGHGTSVKDKSPQTNHGTLHGGRWSPRVEEGYRLANPIALDALGTVASSRVTWEADASTDKNQPVVIHAGLSDSHDSLPQQWQQIENGQAITMLKVGQSVQGKYLWIKQTLLRTERHSQTPGLQSLQLEITGR